MSTLSMLKSCTKVLAVILAAAPLTAAVHAQTSTRVHVDIPFGFQTSTRYLPAGSYVVQMEQGHVIAISGTGGSSFAISVPDQDLKPNYAGKMVFRRIGARYFLREVWMPGQSSHVHLPATKPEKEALLASNNLPSGNVELALLGSSR